LFHHEFSNSTFIKILGKECPLLEASLPPFYKPRNMLWLM